MGLGKETFLSSKRRVKLSVAIPTSLVSDVPHLREKTLKVGLVGRAAAIFRVDEIIVFPDILGADQRRDAELIAAILSYMETPQYLRKRLFKIRPELRYAGILPPLRTPHHPLSDRIKDLTPGERREGVVVSQVKDGVLVDVGVEQPALVPNLRIPVNTRVTVKITKLKRGPKAILVGNDEIEKYWGYRVKVSNTLLSRFLKEHPYDLIVATSRRGVSLTEVLDELTRRWEKAHTVLVAFGAPTQGLYEITAREGINLNEVAHFVVNTIPHQGTETVRTEEAIYATLAILNLLVSRN
ncbi:MAG: RNA methyltransferase [Candidatus Bathyarchaeia archaeon]